MHGFSDRPDERAQLLLDELQLGERQRSVVAALKSRSEIYEEAILEVFWTDLARHTGVVAARSSLRWFDLVGQSSKSAS
jgi:hypothetical protein